MTIDRAIEILTPDRRPDYSPEEYEEALEMARAALNQMICDVAEIVLCKDCRCGKESVDLFGGPAIECEVNGETKPLYWYCAGGEPKE